MRVKYVVCCEIRLLWDCYTGGLQASPCASGAYGLSQHKHATHTIYTHVEMCYEHALLYRWVARFTLCKWCIWRISSANTCGTSTPCTCNTLTRAFKTPPMFVLMYSLCSLVLFVHMQDCFSQHWNLDPVYATSHSSTQCRTAHLQHHTAQ
jgi:hypothetical protein